MRVLLESGNFMPIIFNFSYDSRSYGPCLLFLQLNWLDNWMSRSLFYWKLCNGFPSLLGWRLETTACLLCALTPATSSAYSITRLPLDSCPPSTPDFSLVLEETTLASTTEDSAQFSRCPRFQPGYLLVILLLAQMSLPHESLSWPFSSSSSPQHPRRPSQH